MDLSTLKNASTVRKQRKRIGRGPSSGTGKTSGKGHKGQKARSGYAATPGFEGGQMPLYRRLPKRGFNHASRFPFAVINLDVLDQAFEDGAVITPDVLFEKGLAKETRGGIKILGRGEITKNITITAHAISPGARAKIEAAGGAVTIVSMTATHIKLKKNPAAKQETK
jgi:large subunit ribosomal protein L15